jgi:ketosteroid isomerase-like protein
VADKTEPAHDPRDLERFLVTRQRVGDLDGMVALYEPGAIIDSGDGSTEGKDSIRTFFAEIIASGRKFQLGEQRAAVVSGDLALTSTRFPDGSISAEVARRQGDGTWLG